VAKTGWERTLVIHDREIGAWVEASVSRGPTGAGPATQEIPIQQAGAPRHVLADGRPAAPERRLGRRGIITRFVLLNAAIGVILIGLGALLSVTAARREAVNDAQLTTNLLAVKVVQPNIPDGLIEGDPQAIARLDRIIRARVIDEDLVRVKIWSETGRIVYSNEPRLIGAVFPLPEQELSALHGNRVEAEVSEGGSPENIYEDHFGELLEVYMPIRTPEGDLVLFETYSLYSTVRQQSSSIFWTIAPITLGTALLLGLALWPLMQWMFSQLESIRRERERLLQRALDATDQERRRIVGNLHDGIVQDLTGASLVATSAATAARRTGNETLARETVEAATAIREGLRGLRSALVEIYPPALRGSTFAEAVGDLVAPLRNRGTHVVLDIPEDFEATPAVESVLYRVAQEAVRNASKHSGADSLHVHVIPGGRRVTLAVSDNGRGFTPPLDSDGAMHLVERDDGSHVGLSLLTDLARNTGARLELVTAPGAGTTVTVEVALP
jgi:signal transduction histidine kinase